MQTARTDALFVHIIPDICPVFGYKIIISYNDSQTGSSLDGIPA
jgi:hypothetical protein